MSEVTRVLASIEQGDPHAAAQLLPLVYDELRQLAARRLAHEAPGQTLQATALVHEAYLRLVGMDQARHWNSCKERRRCTRRRSWRFGRAAARGRGGQRRKRRLTQEGKKLVILLRSSARRKRRL
jgi:hypothetical protein